MVVELEDLTPVGVGGGRGVAVDGVDRGLDLERSRHVAAQARPHQGLALGDERSVPLAAVLVGEQHDGSIGRDAGGAARLGEQQQGEQSEHLGLVGHQLGQQPGQADRLGAQLVAHEVIAAWSPCSPR